MTHIRMEQFAARTFNIERETLIQLLDFAVREGLILENPGRVVPRRKQPKVQIASSVSSSLCRRVAIRNHRALWIGVRLSGQVAKSGKLPALLCVLLQDTAKQEPCIWQKPV